MRPSIRQRLGLSSLLVLLLFLGLAGLLLQTAQMHSLEAGIEGRLLGHVYALLGVAEIDAGGQPRLPEPLADPRLQQPDSGLYAMVADGSGSILWRSPSMLGSDKAPLPSLDAGQTLFRLNGPHYELLYGIEWELEQGGIRPFVIGVFLDRAEVGLQAARFRATLWSGLLGLGLVLLSLQVLVLRWGLAPLQRIAGALKAVETGEAANVEGDYPRELSPLADNINALLRHNRRQHERYSNSLFDLAHSVKTPLAVLKGALDEEDDRVLRDTTAQAVLHIDALIRGRLGQASIGGGDGLARGIRLRPLLQRLIDTLSKVYRDKQPSFDIRVGEDCRVGGDDNDLLELFGNLLDNACKYGRGKVRIGAAGEAGRATISIEDDGPGIPEAMIDAVLTRGTRLDERQPGQGIGLAAAKSLVDLQKGTMSIESSDDLGGAKIVIRVEQR